MNITSRFVHPISHDRAPHIASGREGGRPMRISDIIKQALEKKGFRNLKDASRALNVSSELLRVTINKGHIPKDRTLGMMADRLGLDRSLLILVAHQEKVPSEIKGFFLSPSQSRRSLRKRVYPLSVEQCEYLEKFMSSEEIQMLRKYRQVSEEAKTQIAGYVDYMIAIHKQGR